jgi:hypothetical protein
LPVRLGDVLQLNTCKIEEGGAVVFGELVLQLVVCGANRVEVRVNLCLYSIEGINDGLALIELLASFWDLFEAEVNVGDRGQGVCICVSR